MSAVLAAQTLTRTLRQTAARHARAAGAAGALLVAWAAHWNSLACDPENDIYIYPFF